MEMLREDTPDDDVTDGRCRLHAGARDRRRSRDTADVTAMSTSGRTPDAGDARVRPRSHGQTP
jgi:hypothetical protein